MTSITFYGATGTVTGSRHLLNVDGMKILLDCGLFQGNKANRLKNWQSFPVPPQSIDRILLSHAHIDHSGFLPKFQKDGFLGVVNCTHATHDICKIILRDSAHIQEEDAKWANHKKFSKHVPALPLYTTEDAENIISRFESINYGEELFLNNSIRVKFKDAGHILGSSIIDIKRIGDTAPRKIVFSGDFGRPNRPVLRNPVQVFNVDFLILESTYGDRLHESTPYKENIKKIVNKSIYRGGILLIPAFSVGRSQTLLYILRELEENNEIPHLPVYMDSPMAINVTDIFKNRISDQDLESRVLKLQGKQIFHPQNLHLCRSTDQSKSINAIKKNAIIISASGMVTGGRILHHMVERLPNSNDTILFMGYQAEGTRGRTILEGKQNVKIHGRRIPIHAHIEQITGLSGHADYNEILAWLIGFNKPPKKTFLVHGEAAASKALASKIRKTLRWDVVVPSFGEKYDIDF